MTATAALTPTLFQKHQDPGAKSGDGLFPETLRATVDALTPRHPRPAAQEKPARKHAELDPTAAAVAELASAGAMKPVQAQAAKAQLSESPNVARAPESSQPEVRPAEQPRTTESAARHADTRGSKPQQAPQESRPAQGLNPTENGQPAPESKPAQAPAAATAQAMPAAQVQSTAAKPATIAASRVGGIAPASGPTNAARAPVTATRAVDPGKARAAAQPTRSHPAPAEETFAAQLRRGLAAALRQRGGSVTMRLEPEALGHVKIKMHLAQGKVAASFEVGTDQARRLLEKTKDTLRSALEAKGLSVDRLEVQLSARSAGETPTLSHDPSGTGSHAGSEHPGGGGMSQRPARMQVEPRAPERATQGREEPRMGGIAGGALDALA